MARTLNILCAILPHFDGKTYHLAHIREMNDAFCVETGKHAPWTRREFRKRVKLLGGKILPQLKTGEFINTTTGQVDKLWGID